MPQTGHAGSLAPRKAASLFSKNPCSLFGAELLEQRPGWAQQMGMKVIVAYSQSLSDSRSTAGFQLEPGHGYNRALWLPVREFR